MVPIERARMVQGEGETNRNQVTGGGGVNRVGVKASSSEVTAIMQGAKHVCLYSFVT